MKWAKRREGGRQRGWISGKRRREMLNKVRLIDVAAGDRRSNRLDRGGVVLRRPGRLPLADGEPAVGRAGTVGATRRQQRQWARLRRGGPRCTAKGLRERVAEVDVGTLAVAQLSCEPGLELLEGAVGVVDLEHAQPQ